MEGSVSLTLKQTLGNEISYPDLLSKKPTARSRQLRKFMFFWIGYSNSLDSEEMTHVLSSGCAMSYAILRNGVFSPLFSKYVLFVWNKLCPPIKRLICRRVWGLLILLTVQELISQSSKFSRITILRNGVFSPLFSKYVLFVRNKFCPPIKWLIFRRVWAPLILLTVLELISQSSNFARTTILRNGLSRLFCDAVKLFLYV